MLLERLVHGKEPSTFLLLEDSLECPALPLLKEVVASASLDHEVLVLATETPPSFFRGVGNQRRVRLFDAYSDPFGWERDKNTNSVPSHYELVGCLDDPRRVTGLLLEVVQNLTQNRFTLVIDSVEFFLRRLVGVPCLKRLIAAAKGLSQVVAIHHGDVPVPLCRRLGDETAWPWDRWQAHSALEYLAVTRVEIRHSRRLNDVYSTAFANWARRTWRPPEDVFEYFCVDVAERSAVCLIEHSRRSGKVMKDMNGFIIAPDETITFRSEEDLLAELRRYEVKRGRETLDESGDPTANLSFNLTLTEDQKEAKSKVALPYLKAQEQATGSGAIFYAPDAADDFDEDDPDDDLNF